VAVRTQLSERAIRTRFRYGSGFYCLSLARYS
jgi:hypothetical protein